MNTRKCIIDEKAGFVTSWLHGLLGVSWEKPYEIIMLLSSARGERKKSSSIISLRDQEESPATSTSVGGCGRGLGSLAVQRAIARASQDRNKASAQILGDAQVTQV